MSRHYQFVVDQLPRRRIRHAHILMALGGTPDTLIAEDAEQDEFVRLPQLQLNPDARIMCLSPDGTRIVALADHAGRRFGGLCVHTLATGEQQWLTTPAGTADWLAGMSPDGKYLATFGTDSGTRNWIIDVVQLTTEARRRIQTGQGGWVNETRISWSPDGRRIASTYVTTDDNHATIIVGLDGTILGHFDDMVTLPCPNGTWLTDHQLLVRDESFQLHILDFAEQASHPLGPLPETLVAVMDGRLVWCGPTPPLVLTTTAIDGTDRQPLLTATGAHDLPLFDLAVNLAANQEGPTKPR